MNKIDYCKKHIDIFLNKTLNSLTIAYDSYNDMMQLNNGTIFYKYYSLADPYTLDNILNGVIHFSNPVKFNDPFDSLMGISIDSIIKSYMKKLVLPYIQTNNCDERVKQLIVNLFEPVSSNNLLDEIDDYGIIDDLKNNKEVSEKKKMDFTIKLMNQHPELLKKIKNGKLSSDELIEILDLGHSKFLRKTINGELEKNDYNIKLFTTDNLIDELQNICKKNNVNFDWDKLKLDIEEKKKELFDLLNSTLADMIRITCFSETRDNILMWSHYANKHDGICVAYDFKKSIELQTLALPIKYDDNRPIISEKEVKFTDNEWLIDKEGLNRLLLDSFLIKSESWKYENEWRVLLPKEKLINDNFHTDSIVAIYFGVKVSDEVIKDTITKIKEKGITNVKYYKMKMHDTSFVLVEQEIS